MLQRRQGMIVWVQNLKHVRQLRKYGHVQYVSKKMKYVVFYCNADEAEQVRKSIKQLPFVKKTEWSERNNLNMDFQKIEKKRRIKDEVQI